mmetsp:Transcript_40082/g.69398  ORF Transcript_40082/g.69398 Transcript_40082/m.69398 type:complete len:331 (-) Transcript_40082:1131-2123(-)
MHTMEYCHSTNAPIASILCVRHIHKATKRRNERSQKNFTLSCNPSMAPQRTCTVQNSLYTTQNTQYTNSPIYTTNPCTAHLSHQLLGVLHDHRAPRTADSFVGRLSHTASHSRCRRHQRHTRRRTERRLGTRHIGAAGVELRALGKVGLALSLWLQGRALVEVGEEAVGRGSIGVCGGCSRGSSRGRSRGGGFSSYSAARSGIRTGINRTRHLSSSRSLCRLLAGSCRRSSGRRAGGTASTTTTIESVLQRDGLALVGVVLHVERSVRIIGVVVCVVRILVVIVAETIASSTGGGEVTLEHCRRVVRIVQRHRWAALVVGRRRSEQIVYI